jgi:hypothetical protein
VYLSVQFILSSLDGSLTIIQSEVAQYAALCVQPKQANGYSDSSTEYRDHNDTVRDRLRVIEVRGHSRRRRHCSNGAPAINHLSQDEWWVSESKLIGRRELLWALLDNAPTYPIHICILHPLFPSFEKEAKARRRAARCNHREYGRTNRSSIGASVGPSFVSRIAEVNVFSLVPTL